MFLRTSKLAYFLFLLWLFLGRTTGTTQQREISRIPGSVEAVADPAPRVNKVEPPNWWLRHTRNPIQIMLIGEELKSASVTGSRDAFQIEVRSTSDDGRYVFAYVDIASHARPGNYHFQVTTAAGSASFDFTLVAAEVVLGGRMIRTPGHKYVTYQGDPVEQLFDMQSDSGETRNLAVDSAQASLLADHRKLLKEWESQLKPAPTA